MPNATVTAPAGPVSINTLEGFKNEDLRVRLQWQETFRFPPPSSNAPEFSSFSKELRPDFGIIVNHANSDSWFVLDAKHSTGPSILERMQAAHIYHDAPRRRTKRSLR